MSPVRAMRAMQTSSSAGNLLALGSKSIRSSIPLAIDAGRAISSEQTGHQPPPRTVSAQSMSAAVPNLPSSANSDDPSRWEGKTLRERLDFRPRLGILDKVVCLVAPAAICAVLYLGVRPHPFKPLYGVGLAMIYTAWLAITRAFLLERQYTKRLVSAEELGDPDSKFPVIGGLKVHAKVFKPKRSEVRAQMHCFHGFGANVESWDSVQKRLAEQTSILVSSHDKPGFGLTERPVEPKKYSSEFNAYLGRTIMDLEEQNLHEASSSSPGQENNPRLKRILVGHSMGAGSAAAEAILHPKDVHAIILVAPAIMCFNFLLPSQGGRSGVAKPEGQSYTVQFPSEHVMPIPERSAKGNKLKRTLFAAARAVFGRVSRLISLILAPVTIVGLRASVRSRVFWEKGLARAWYDKSKLSAKIIDAYRKPQLVKGWERGLVNFTSSRLGGSSSIRQTISDAWHGRVKPLQAEQLANIVNTHNIKVLIVHGKQDGVVPANNSQRLASLIPSSQLVIWDETGHLPHEEHPDKFIDLVESFSADL